MWDSCYGEHEATGFASIKLAIDDIRADEKPDEAVFALMHEGAQSKGKGPGIEQQGLNRATGILGGGVYEAEARKMKHRTTAEEFLRPKYAAQPDTPSPMMTGGAPTPPQHANQSSISGGIFGAAQQPPPPSSGAQSQRNRSSIEGGIFGAAPIAHSNVPSRSQRNANASSVPGGIFG